MLSTVEDLEQSNRNIALYLRNNPDICFQVYLNMDFETTLHFLTGPRHFFAGFIFAGLIFAGLGESVHIRIFGH